MTAPAVSPALHPTATVDGEPRPRRGRPRAAGVDEAILSATLDLAGECGIEGVSMDAVAQRVGVSKATIYRRWPSKDALVLDALGRAMSPFDQVDTGALRGDLVEFLGEIARRMATGRTSEVLPYLIGVAVHDRALRESLDEYIRYRRQPLIVIVERGIARGELPTDTDVDVLIDTLIGPFTYRRLFNIGTIDDEFVGRLLSIVLPGL